MNGICPNCLSPGAVSSPCPNRACSAQGYHCVPEDRGATRPSKLTGRDTVVGKRIDEYLVVRKLGEGGFGSVYLALQTPVMMKTALKLLKVPEDAVFSGRMDKFEREALALAQLSHPNIVRLIKFGTVEEVPYIVMEYVADGHDLSKEIARRAKASQELSVAEIRHIMTQLLRALRAAHEGGLVHRDIKPGNLMLQRTPDDPLLVRVGDFGLAKSVAEGSDTTLVQGTPIYMAPEQFTGTDIGPWTDLYSAGVLLFELLTGERAFATDTTAALFKLKMEAENVLARRQEDADLPGFAQAFFSTATARHPTERFASADEFLASMNAMLDRLESLGRNLLRTGGLAALADPVLMAEVVSEDRPQPQFELDETVAAPAELDRAAIEEEATMPSPVSAPARRSPWLVPAIVGGGVILLAAAYYLLAALFAGPSDAPEKQPAAPPEAAVPAVNVPVPPAPAVSAGPQAPGPGPGEFQANVYTRQGQKMPHVTTFPDGRFVVAWDSQQGGSGREVFARVHSPGEDWLTDEFQVNTYTSGNQFWGVPAVLEDSGFLVVWHSEAKDGDGYGVCAQRYSADYRRERGEIQVNSYHLSDQHLPDAAGLPEGEALVIWQSKGQDGDDFGIFGRLFKADGSRKGEEFAINSVTAGEQSHADLSAFPGNGFVVVWEGPGENNSRHIFARVFGRTAEPEGVDFEVSASRSNTQRWPSVACLGDERMVVAWSCRERDGSGWGVFAQIVGRDGSREGEEFQVNTYFDDHQWLPRVGAWDADRFAIAWMSDNQDGSGRGVFGRSYSEGGVRSGGEKRLNSHTEFGQQIRSLAPLADGRMVVVWESEEQDGSGAGVFGTITDF